MQVRPLQQPPAAISSICRPKLSPSSRRHDFPLLLQSNFAKPCDSVTQLQLRALQNGLPAAAGRRMSLELLGDSGGTRRRSIGAGDEEKARLDAQRELNKMQVGGGGGGEMGGPS
jgi:hypothetical protein